MNKPNDWTLTSDLQTGSDLEIEIVWFCVEVVESMMEPLQLWQHLINTIIFALFIHVKHLHKCWN